MKVRILYNACNIDSCLAVNMLVSVMKEKTQGYYFETVPFTKFDNYQAPSQESQFTFIVGVPMPAHDVLVEKDKSNTTVYFNYNTNTKDLSHMLNLYDLGVKIFTPNYNGGHIHNDVESILDNSLCKLMNLYLKVNFDKDIYGDEAANFETIKLIQAAMNYVNFDKNLTEDDLIYLYSNYDEIIHCAANIRLFKPTPYMPDGDFKILGNINESFDQEETKKVRLQDCPRIQTARNIIHRNLSDHRHGTKSKGVVLPTACVSEEHAMDVMRLMSYPYTTVVTFEDVKYWRIWRIYSKTPEQIDLLADLIPHESSWMENKVGYLMSALSNDNK